MRDRLRREGGQVLVLVALALPLLFGMMAIVVDAANLMVQRRSMQNAADASVLAAAHDLTQAFIPSCMADPVCVAALRATAAADAAAYSAKNGGPSTLTQRITASDTNCYSWPYKSDNGRIEVRLRKSIETSFAAVVGMGSAFDASARAVGTAHPVTGADGRSRSSPIRTAAPMLAATRTASRSTATRRRASTPS